ncbi:MAG: hypothetical protein JXB49_22355 [Bacteroidales bacterium]|nr:hypothetical protein [Bacteroidales bacterium]
MKVIVSHDIDHITALEHLGDNILIKMAIKSIIELTRSKISRSEFANRIKEVCYNRFQNIQELIEFDLYNKIPATFFIGVANGLGLSYSHSDAIKWSKIIRLKGFDIGIHGIEYTDLNIMKEEYEKFKLLINDNQFGIRMHYLRTDESTLLKLDKLHYLFDSSIESLSNCYKIGSLWEFPVHIMDGRIWYHQKRFQNDSIKTMKKKTIEIIEVIKSQNIRYFTILFHDRYFSPSYMTFKNWYLWLIQYLQKQHFEFVSYRQAIRELAEIP